MNTSLSKYFGNYPAEYNRAVHGPYDPARFYGKADTPLAQVKMGELGAWLNRRNVHPVAISQSIGRGYHRMLRRYAQPKYASGTIWFFQMIFIASSVGYLMNYPKNISHHKQYKYHW